MSKDTQVHQQAIAAGADKTLELSGGIFCPWNGTEHQRVIEGHHEDAAAAAMKDAVQAELFRAHSHAIKTM
jgi:hypothetical protein